MAILTKDPTTGQFSGTGGGGMASTAPSATTPYGSPATGYFANYSDAVDAANKITSAPTGGSSDGSTSTQSPTASLGSMAPSKQFTPPAGQVSVPTSTGNQNLDQVLGVPAGAPPPPAGSNPYTLFNTYVASIITQIQNGASAGRANLAGAANTLTSESVAPNGPTSFDPTVFSNNQVGNQQSLQSGFQPAITSINSQLSNANADISGLTSAIPGIAAATLPTQVSGGSSLMTPGGQTVGTAPVYNSSINPLTLQPYGWSQAPGGSGGSGASGSGIATSTGNVDVTSYSTNPNYTSMMRKQYTSTSSDLQTLMQQMGGDSATVMTQYIKNNAPKSQITGPMVTSIAGQYGIDPAFLASQMLLETDFGTAGEAPANNNPGGVKFAGQPGATRGSPAPDGGDYAKFASWSQGIAAEASFIAKNQNGGSSTTANSSVSGPSGLPPQLVSMITSDASALANGTVAPSVLQARYNAMPGGVGGLYYNMAIAQAKQINPTFNETAANLKYQGQQTSTENMNSGNPLTSIYSNLKNFVTSPSGANILSPVPSSPTVSNGVDLSQFN